MPHHEGQLSPILSTPIQDPPGDFPLTPLTSPDPEFSPTGKVLDEKPEDAVDLLETSVIAKKTAFKPADPPLMAADPKNVATAVALKELYCAPKR